MTADSMNEKLVLLKALCEETRYKIIHLLMHGELCACKIPSRIKRTQSNTSMHLAMLSKAGILKSRRDGKKILYSIKDFRVCGVFKALGKSKETISKKSCCGVKK